mgnify:CR=1 FL=1
MKKGVLLPILTIVLAAAVLFGAAFGPVMLLALFWRRSNRQGTIAGLVVGGVMIFVWKFLVRPLGGILNIYELLPAFLIAMAVNAAVSLMTEAPDKYDAVVTIRVKGGVNSAGYFTEENKAICAGSKCITKTKFAKTEGEIISVKKAD